MKLTDLNVALRDLKGNPKLKLRIGYQDEVGIDVTIEKSKFMIALKERFVERSAETDLWLTEDGYVRLESARNGV